MLWNAPQARHRIAPITSARSQENVLRTFVSARINLAAHSRHPCVAPLENACLPHMTALASCDAPTTSHSFVQTCRVLLSSPSAALLRSVPTKSLCGVTMVALAFRSSQTAPPTDQCAQNPVQCCALTARPVWTTPLLVPMIRTTVAVWRMPNFLSSARPPDFVCRVPTIASLPCPHAKPLMETPL